MTQTTAREVVTTLARCALRAFLDAGCTLDCRPRGTPRASLLIPLHNHAELTLLCFQSLALHLNQTPFEIIVVDNGSTDETAQLLEAVQGLRVIRNEKNLGYPRAINQAAQLAAGDYFILLNNDVQLLGNCIDGAVDYLDAHADVGAVGGKIILLEGTLQEAGVTLGQDGWMYCHGVGESPDHPAYAFEREVDYCSGAFLTIRRRLFRDLGGLDEIFSPGYFEESDFCARLWQAGWRVVYVPDLAVLHFQNATSSALANLTELVQRNHRIFIEKQAAWLATRSGCTWPLLARRARADSKFHVLIIEETASGSEAPTGDLGEIEEIIPRMESLDAFVTLCLIDDPAVASHSLKPILARLPRTVEIVHVEAGQVQEWLNGRALYYDLIVARDPGLIARHCPATARSSILRGGQLELMPPADLIDRRLAA
jgi:GT2 family glycosyltransferase